MDGQVDGQVGRRVGGWLDGWVGVMGDWMDVLPQSEIWVL